MTFCGVHHQQLLPDNLGYFFWSLSKFNNAMLARVYLNGGVGKNSMNYFLQMNMLINLKHRIENARF